MVIIMLIVLGIIVSALIPKIKKFVNHHYCTNCHSWTTLRLGSFDSEYVVTGHDQHGLFSGLAKTLKFLGLFGGINYTKDRPFLRFFGTGHYICPKCCHEIMIEEHHDRR